MHSGTHFLRNALLSARDISISDEVFLNPPPPEMAQAMHLNNSVWAPLGSSLSGGHERPCHGCSLRQLPAVVQPVLDLYWGILPEELDASSRLTNRSAHYVCHDRYFRDTDNPCGANSTEDTWDITWGQLRDNLMRKRALGSLWNHNNEVEDGQPFPGIFARHRFLEHLKQLGARVLLYERSNGLAASLSNSNTKTEQHIQSYGNTEMKPRNLTLLQLRRFHQHWQKRDIKYRTAFGVLQREGIPVAFTTYERLMTHPDDFTTLFSFIGVEAPPAGAIDTSHSTKWHTAPPKAYISNAKQVRRWINGGRLPLWSECMLEDNCATMPPIYSGV
jgi:hypothetical protein